MDVNVWHTDDKKSVQDYTVYLKSWHLKHYTVAFVYFEHSKRTVNHPTWRSLIAHIAKFRQWHLKSVIFCNAEFCQCVVFV